MKSNCLLTLAFLLVGNALFAQFTARGNFIMGASLGFSAATSKVTDGSSTSNPDSPASSQFNVTPKVGYMVIDNLALGIGLDYTFSRQKSTLDQETNDSDLLFGPFTRYYAMLGEDKAFFFELNFGFGNSSNNSPTQNIQTNIFAVGVGPGFTIFSDDAIGLEALVKYNFSRSKFNTDINGVQSKTVTLSNQFDLSLGIQFYFAGVAKASKGSGSNQRLY